MASVYEEKISAKVWLIHAEKISLYNFIILRRKETPAQVFSCGIRGTFHIIGGCF